MDFEAEATIRCFVVEAAQLSALILSLVAIPQTCVPGDQNERGKRLQCVRQMRQYIHAVILHTTTFVSPLIAPNHLRVSLLGDVQGRPR